jgi:hypothetical protein
MKSIIRRLRKHLMAARGSILGRKQEDFVDSIFSPIFFPRVPEIKPRTLWACQSVAFMMSFKLAPPARFSRSSTFSVLLPWRAPGSVFTGWAALAPLARFFAGVVLFPDLRFEGATCGFCARVLAFLVASGFSAVCVAGADSWFSVVSVVIVNSPSAVIAVVTWIALVRRRSKRILRKIQKSDGLAMTVVLARSWQHLASDGSPRLNTRTQTGGRHRRAAHPAQR